MKELSTHVFNKLKNHQIATELLSLASFIGSHETGINKERVIALLVVASSRLNVDLFKPGNGKAGSLKLN